MSVYTLDPLGIFTHAYNLQVLIWIYFYDMTVTHFGNPKAIAGLPWTFNLALGIHALLVGVIQSFFAFRIYSVTGNVWWAMPGWFCALSRTAISWVVAVYFGLQGLDEFKATHGYLVLVTLIISIIVRGPKLWPMREH